MIGKRSISILLGMVVSVVAETPDLLRFTNGDQLHGSLEGVKAGPQVIWKREDVSEPVDFKVSQLRHIVIGSGKAANSLASLSNVGLVNGDRIPGVVTALDQAFITVETEFAGSLKFSRDQVAMLAPSPLGGRISYYGPFVETEWQMTHASFPEGLPPIIRKEAITKAADDDADEDDFPGRWRFSGSAWYWQNKSSGTALVLRESMPTRSVVRFNIAWKNRLSLAIAFNADFTKPKPVKEAGDMGGEALKAPQRFVPGDSSVLPILFGNSYVLQIFASHFMLYRTSVNGEGVASVERMQVNSNGLRLPDSGDASFEVRSNRRTGQISLFMNGEFSAQWNENSNGSDLMPAERTNHATEKLGGLGFVVQAENSAVKISDVMIGEWNGMPDSARSLQADDKDIVLLTNGTDRFSGDVKFFKDNKISMVGKFGEFQIPLEDVAEIRFAKNQQSSVKQEAVDQVVIRFSPFGQVTGQPLAGDSKSLRILHPVAGQLNINMESVVMLDFKPSNNIIDDWDSKF